MDDRYIDEDGEPLMDFDARDPSPEPQPYDDLEDDLGDDGGGADWNRDRSPTPVHGDDGAGSSSKPRKRLLKKAVGGGGGDGMTSDGLDDWGEEAAALADTDVDPEANAARKRKGPSQLRPVRFSLPRPRHRPPDPVACRAASRWADRLFADFHLLPTAAPADPPDAAPSCASASQFVPLFPDATEHFLPLQVDFYKILGADPHFLGDGIRRAFEARIAKPLQYGYNTDALVGCQQMLQLAHDTLTNQSSRTEYDRALSENRDAVLTMDVAWDKMTLQKLSC